MTFNDFTITYSGCHLGPVTQRLWGVKPLNITDLGDDGWCTSPAHRRNAGEQFNRSFFTPARVPDSALRIQCAHLSDRLVPGAQR